MKSPMAYCRMLAVLLPVFGCDRAESPMPASPPASSIGPRLEVPVRTHDFGQVDLGQSYQHEFPLHNRGDRPLRLSLTRTSCKCAAITLAPQLLPPGESGGVIFHWEPVPGQFGRQVLAAEIDSDDPHSPRIRLEVSGRVVPTVRIWPEDWFEVDFDVLGPDQVAERQLKVFSTTLPTFDLTARVTHPGIQVTIEPLTVNAPVGEHTARCGYAVTLRTTRALPRGFFREMLVLQVLSNPPREIRLPVYGEVESGAIRIMPREVEFKQPRLALGDSRKMQVQFLVPAEPDQVEVVRCEPDFLKVDPPQRMRPGLWLVTVRLPPNQAEAEKLQPLGFFEGRLVLKTTAPGAAEVPVRIKWVRPDS